MRSPVTLVIQSFNALTEDEKKLCLDFIAPEPEPEPVVKQTRKKRTTKSAKTQSLSSANAKVPKADADTDEAAERAQSIIGNGGERCTATVESNGLVCGMPESYQLHHDKGYVDYHPFESSAPVVERKSRRKGAAANSTPSSETGAENALSASGD